MVTSHPEEIQLTPDQRHRLGAVYRLILSWGREKDNRKAGQNNQSVHVAVPPDELETVVHPPDLRGLT